MSKINIKKFQLSEQCSFLGIDKNKLSADIYICGNINILFHVLVYINNDTNEDYPNSGKEIKYIDDIQEVINSVIDRFEITITEIIYYDN